ncbi:phytanoyl-CoA dioxygenase family protein [Neolewinella lacunae]|uniref:Phytanoyl-CoA dioxygenase family protein n=1 Tax=Neolewinella lacunae TaxID=1517758 RepID=A0A923T788_9BACT|nr:phytanoyl-CoA dioxygenase family protein [Neolewinella lacunae]MBC6993324.1 phytanoyl-CoA dioxygenase family protein [Neolewinella lacunae]MDN3636835.1 phytanoyl-CoA dioxygenase family protein [Neolewinella lacunae]
MNLSIINQPFALTPAQIADYQRNGFLKIKEVIPPDVIEHFNAIISAKVAQLNKVAVPLEERDTYGKAFLQLFNLWREDADIKELVFSRRLAQIATDLMQVDGVRIYHDQALFKEGGGGITPWHADQHYWPLSSDKTVTVWIPLQATPLKMGPLEFSAGSQRIVLGRELSISDTSEKVIRENLRINNFPHTIEPFDIGEVSFHSGWVFHRAGANTTQEVRKVMTIIYMDKDIKLKQPENSGQENDWKTWCPGVEIGHVAASPLNPVLFEH